MFCGVFGAHGHLLAWNVILKPVLFVVSVALCLPQVGVLATTSPLTCQGLHALVQMWSGWTRLTMRYDLI